MQNYINLIEDLYDLTKDSSNLRLDRTGVGTYSIFSPDKLYFNLAFGFPLLPYKYTHFKSIVHELLWMLKGTGYISYLRENSVTIWDEWADKDGYLGPVYGVQWRKWRYVSYDGFEKEIDQIKTIIHNLKTNPNSRRHILSAWNVGELENMALEPCHVMAQFYVTNDGKLNCLMTQRSSDVFLGLPFNIAQYGLLTHIIAHMTNLKVGILSISLGDAHLYSNHVEQAETMLKRYNMSDTIALPKLEINANVDDIDSIVYDDITLHGYKHLGKLSADVAV